jgi:hypothetical protein
MRPERQIDGFHDAVNTCGFTNLGFLGLPYTWDNRQHRVHNIMVLLDRAFANPAFTNMFRDVKVWHV